MKKITVTPLWEDRGDIVAHASVDRRQDGVRSGVPATLRGVVVLAQGVTPGNLSLRSASGTREIDWHQPSPVIARRFPGNPQAARSRFSGTALLAEGEPAELVLSLPGTELALFRIGIGGALYDEAFYARQREGSRRSADIVLDRLLSLAPVRSAIDFGCGAGTWLDALAALGIDDLAGLEGSWILDAGTGPRTHALQVIDLNHPPRLPRRYDLAMSLEVAEHLDPASSPAFVAALCEAADLVLFGAAYEGQPGDNHVNCRRHSEWAALFAAQGYEVFDALRPYTWGNDAIDPWYRQNTFLYARRESAAHAQLRTAGLVPMPDTAFMDCVHPWLYSLASRRTGR